MLLLFFCTDAIPFFSAPVDILSCKQAAVQRSFNKLLTLRGFLAQGWEVLNLEEARASSVLLTNSNSSGGVGGAYPGVGAGNTGPVRVASEVSVGIEQTWMLVCTTYKSDVTSSVQTVLLS
jgi:hypothetical protein